MTEHLSPDQIALIRSRRLPIEESFALLEHAATCQRCSQMIVTAQETRLAMAGVKVKLREGMTHLTLDNIADLVDGKLALPEKQHLEAHLAECTDCSGFVQAVTDLSHAELLTTSRQRSRHSKTGFWAALSSWPALSQAAVAASLIVVIIGVAALAVRHWTAEPQTATSNQHGPAPRTVPAPVPQTAHSPEEVPAPAQGPSAHPASVLAFSLASGLVRGQSSQILTVPAKTDLLKLTLKSRSELASGRYVVTISDPSRHITWRSTARVLSKENSIVVEIPAHVLHTGQYLLTLSASGDASDEEAEDYTFQIQR